MKDADPLEMQLISHATEVRSVDGGLGTANLVQVGL
jgi:hypothetical protein